MTDNNILAATSGVAQESVPVSTDTKLVEATPAIDFDFSYDVYVKTDANGSITEVNSSAFIHDTTGWTWIDKGEGDKYHHAQGNYLEDSVVDERGSYNYKLVDGKVTKRTSEDKSGEYAKLDAYAEITELKSKLAKTDYIAAKIAEGAATREDYAEKLDERESWRLKINELQEQYGI